MIEWLYALFFNKNVELLFFFPLIFCFILAGLSGYFCHIFQVTSTPKWLKSFITGDSNISTNFSITCYAFGCFCLTNCSCYFAFIRESFFSSTSISTSTTTSNVQASTFSRRRVLEQVRQPKPNWWILESCWSDFDIPLKFILAKRSNLLSLFSCVKLNVQV